MLVLFPPLLSRLSGELLLAAHLQNLIISLKKFESRLLITEPLQPFPRLSFFVNGRFFQAPLFRQQVSQLFHFLTKIEMFSRAMPVTCWVEVFWVPHEIFFMHISFGWYNQSQSNAVDQNGSLSLIVSVVCS